MRTAVLARDGVRNAAPTTVVCVTPHSRIDRARPQAIKDTNRLRAECVSGRCEVPRGGAEPDADEDRSLVTPAYKHQLRYRAREDTTSPAARADARTICVKPSLALGANITAPPASRSCTHYRQIPRPRHHPFGSTGLPFPDGPCVGQRGCCADSALRGHASATERPAESGRSAYRRAPHTAVAITRDRATSDPSATRRT